MHRFAADGAERREDRRQREPDHREHERGAQRERAAAARPVVCGRVRRGEAVPGVDLLARWVVRHLHLRSVRVHQALQQECRSAKNGRQRRDVLDLMREKLRKAGEAMIADVEEEEHEAALEHGDAATAAAAAEKKSMKDLTGKLMGAQKAAQGLQLTDDHHTHLRKRALAGCTDSHAGLDEENERMLAAIKRMAAIKEKAEAEHAHHPEHVP